jgi:hypothetical protein
MFLTICSWWLGAFVVRKNEPPNSEESGARRKNKPPRHEDTKKNK